MDRKILFAITFVIVMGVLIAFGVISGDRARSPITNSSMLGADSVTSVKVEEVTYGNGFKGYFARPENAGSYPGVVMIHEWWGLNDNIKDMAENLAKEGYSVVAVDLYDGKVAATQEEARALTSSLNKARAVEHMRAAVAHLRSKGSDKIASLGWCFGGGQSLQLALSGELLDATVIYYGQLVTDEGQLSKITWPVLGIFGGKDTSIPVTSVNAFDAALDKIGVQNEVHVYPNVGHAFANPSGMNYAPNETKDAWEKTVTFLKEALKV
jgi:carboxymethylenebutenolidase